MRPHLHYKERKQCNKEIDTSYLRWRRIALECTAGREWWTEGARPAWPFAFFRVLSPKPKGKGLLVLLTLLPLIKTAIESAMKWPAGDKIYAHSEGKKDRDFRDCTSCDGQNPSLYSLTASAQAPEGYVRWLCWVRLRWRCQLGAIERTIAQLQAACVSLAQVEAHPSSKEEVRQIG